MNAYCKKCNGKIIRQFTDDEITMERIFILRCSSCGEIKETQRVPLEHLRVREEAEKALNERK